MDSSYVVFDGRMYSESILTTTVVPPYLVANLPSLLSKCVVLFLALPDVLFISQSLYVSQLLVGELQLLLVVAVLLHFGLKVTELLLSEQGKEGSETRRDTSSVHLQLHAQLHKVELICISSSDSRGNVTERSVAECFPVIHLILKADIFKKKKKKFKLGCSL